MFPAVYGERERRAGRRALRWEATRELAPGAFLVLTLLAALFIGGLVHL